MDTRHVSLTVARTGSRSSVPDPFTPPPTPGEPIEPVPGHPPTPPMPEPQPDPLVPQPEPEPFPTA